MHLRILSLLAAATNLVSAAPTAQGDIPSFLESRADTSYGTTWNDKYIDKPQGFQIRVAGSACDFQLVYERDPYDNRHDVYYIAEYADGSSVQVRGISGGLARDRVWQVEGYADGRGPQVVFFPSICKNGVAPRTFRANFALRDGFTYKNRYTTGSFGISTGGLPDSVSNIRVAAQEKTSTVTWTPVSGATGYVVLMEWMVYNSEVGAPLPVYVAREVVGGGSSSLTFSRKLTRVAVVAISGAGGTIGSGAKQFTALNRFGDVYP